MDRAARAEGADLTATWPGGSERLACASAEEASARAAFITEALSWVGTPFRDCSDVKGPKGAVDCAMLLVRCAVDTGRLAPFDPRPYSPRHMLHRSEEKFLGWLGTLGASEVATPRIGDIVVWQFGRCFSHGAIIINRGEVVHAYASAGMAIISRRDEPLLRFISDGRVNITRPVKFFDLWSR